MHPRLGGVVALTLLGYAIAGCATATSAGPRDTRVVETALRQVGAPYVRGGASPAGFDCSGLVKYVYGQAGMSVPHGVTAQYRLGVAVSRASLRPGDIVFFDRLRHSGIYIGRNRFVHATKPGDTVKVSRLDEEWFRSRWVGARRLAAVTP